MLHVDIEKTLGSFHLKAQLNAENETLALLGASGCGKSMTLKCIAGIEKPDRGTIMLDGRVLFDSAAHINLMPQQRRVALARILASEPQAILLDEPFSALDSYLNWELELELGELLGAFDGPILWVSHDLGECCRNCTSVCVMESGATTGIRPMQALLDSPGSLSAARLTGCKNSLPLTQEGCVRGWNLPPFAENRGAATLAVPQAALDFDGTDCRFSVLRVIPDAGHEILLLLPETADADAPILRAECPASTMAAAGQTISLSFRREKLLFF